jgi:prevent-host-death family protein
MPKVNMHEAKTHLSKLVERALQGEDVILARNGKALVRLVPIDSSLDQRPVGLHAAKLTDEEAQEAIRPLDDEALGDWQNRAFPDS